jgi:hypothetical protein
MYLIYLHENITVELLKKYEIRLAYYFGVEFEEICLVIDSDKGSGLLLNHMMKLYW